jgi:hypothetical protein
VWARPLKLKIMKHIKFNKEAAGYKFRLDILSQEKNFNLSDKGKGLLWQIFLYSMSTEGFVTKHQAETWTYPNYSKKK